MSQKSSLPQPTQSVSRVLTADTASCPSDCANGRTGSNHWDLVLVECLLTRRGDGRRWSGVERVWASLRARSFQRAHHDGGSMIWVGAVAGLRALEFVPFGAHIGSGCKEAPTCL